MLAAVTFTAALSALQLAGVGYSSDTQQTTQEVCFQAGVSTVTGAESHIQLQRALSFSDLQSQIKVNVAGGFAVGVFEVGAEAAYLRSIQDTSYSQSLNYYQYSSATANVQMQGTGMNALTSFGQQMYANGTNPYFGVVCGDNYVTSYQEGALLLLGLNVILSDRVQKQQFSAAISVGVDDIVTATLKIQTIATQLSLTGRVELGAYQLGGNPNELTSILSKDASGNYYVLSCALNSMSACQTAAQGLLNYATADFPTQYAFDTGAGLSFLGEGFYTYSPIDYLSLKAPKSFVTSDVVQARQNLGTALATSMYYLQNFYPLYLSYPVTWDATSSLYADIKAGYQTSANNIAQILRYTNPEQGAMGCFDIPDQCVALSQQIIAGLVNITAYLAPLAAVATILPFGAEAGNPFAAFMWNGGAYEVAVLPPPADGDVLVSVQTASVTATSLTYELMYQNGKDTDYATFNGTSTSQGATYTGQICTGKKDNKLTCTVISLSSVASPYSFPPYSP